MALAVYSGYNIRKGMFHYYLSWTFLGFIIPMLDFAGAYAITLSLDIARHARLMFIYLGYALTNNGWGYAFRKALIHMLAFLLAWLPPEYLRLKDQHVATAAYPPNNSRLVYAGASIALAIYGITGAVPRCTCFYHKPHAAAGSVAKATSRS